MSERVKSLLKKGVEVPVETTESEAYMGLFGTSNSALSTQMNSMSQQNFKSVNNLLTLQENHVEEFFQYHGEQFLNAFERMIEDVATRVVSQMLVKLQFVSNTNGDLEIHLTHYQSSLLSHKRT